MSNSSRFSYLFYEATHVLRVYLLHVPHPCHGMTRIVCLLPGPNGQPRGTFPYSCTNSSLTLSNLRPPLENLFLGRAGVGGREKRTFPPPAQTPSPTASLVRLSMFLEMSKHVSCPALRNTWRGTAVTGVACLRRRRMRARQEGGGMPMPLPEGVHTMLLTTGIYRVLGQTDNT